jgi:hypothetical protein
MLYDRPVKLSLDGQTSSTYRIKCGLAQGCPSSAPLFLFYNAPLLREVKKETGKMLQDSWTTSPTFPEPQQWLVL